MIERIVKTNDKEADMFLTGEKSYFLRSDKERYEKGYIIWFQNIRNGNPVYHAVSKIKFEVTHIDNWVTAPITKGFQIVSVRATR